MFRSRVTNRAEWTGHPGARFLRCLFSYEPSSRLTGWATPPGMREAPSSRHRNDGVAVYVPHPESSTVRSNAAADATNTVSRRLVILMGGSGQQVGLTAVTKLSSVPVQRARRGRVR
jgi:hypothetical protein